MGEIDFIMFGILTVSCPRLNYISYLAPSSYIYPASAGLHVAAIVHFRLIESTTSLVKYRRANVVRVPTTTDDAAGSATVATSARAIGPIRSIPTTKCKYFCNLIYIR